jgi:hypothetical protein
MKLVITSTAVTNNNWLYSMYKQAQMKEEAFKQEYLCQWINDEEGDKMSESYSWPYNVKLNWSYDELTKKAEVKQEMKLGEFVVEKDGLHNIFDGEFVMLCPGYELEDFVVNKKDKALSIITKKEVGVKKNNYKMAYLSDEYPVKKLGFNVINGVFKLKVEYDIDTNVKVDKSL